MLWNLNCLRYCAHETGYRYRPATDSARLFAGANSTPTPSISMPLVDDLIRNGFFDEQFRILDDSGKPMANVPYFISSENGETFKGVTDNQGLCKRVFSKESAKLTVWLGVLALERW